MAAGSTRVLITGGTGFLGVWLVRACVAAGEDVHLLVRAEGRLARLADVAGRVTPHRADLCDADAVRRAVAACAPEVVYHLAAHGVDHRQVERTAMLATSVLGTANLLDALERHDYRVLVHAGTGAEYGPRDEPIREDDRPAPRTDYGVAKAAASLLCQAEALRGRPVITVRIFSAYGPGEAEMRLVPYVMGCCLRGAAPRVSAGWQVRDYVYAGDVAALLRTAGRRPDLAGHVLHCGTGRPRQVREVVDTVLAVCGGRAGAEFGVVPVRPGEPNVCVASVARTAELTGWRPAVDLRGGIERTWAWFRATAGRLSA